MKHLLATTAIATLLALPAAAQTLDGGVTSGAGVSVGDGGVTAGTGATVGVTADTATEDGTKPKTGMQVTADTGATGSAETFPMDGAAFLATGVEADALDGVRVYDANDTWIGEIHELVVDADGSTRAIIDVGGFLGIGEKPVALSMEDLTISQEARLDTSTGIADGTQPATPEVNPPATAEGSLDAAANIKVSVALTREQLEAMPDYEG
jgi:hypothetical protein